MNAEEHLNRIEKLLYHRGTDEDADNAMESLTALREQIAQLQQPKTWGEYAKSCAGQLEYATEEITALREQIRELERQQSVVTATLNADVFVVVEQLRAQNAVLRDQIAETTKERDEAETVGSVMGEECRLLRQKYDQLKRQTEEEHTAWKARVAALEGGE